MGDGIGKAMGVLNVFAIIGMIGILGGLLFGFFKLIAWIM